METKSIEELIIELAENTVSYIGKPATLVRFLSNVMEGVKILYSDGSMRAPVYDFVQMFFDHISLPWLDAENEHEAIDTLAEFFKSMIRMTSPEHYFELLSHTVRSFVCDTLDRDGSDESVEEGNLCVAIMFQLGGLIIKHDREWKRETKKVA